MPETQELFGIAPSADNRDYCGTSGSRFKEGHFVDAHAETLHAETIDSPGLEAALADKATAADIADVSTQMADDLADVSTQMADGFAAVDAQLSNKASLAVATAESNGLMPSDMFSFLDGKGAVTPFLNLFIREDGDDNNDGLTADTALRTLDGYFDLVSTKYRGYINRLIIDIGPGSFPMTMGIAPHGNDCIIDFLQIIGAGMTQTEIDISAALFTNGNANRVRQVNFSNFMATSNAASTNSYMSRVNGTLYAAFNNIHFNNPTGTARHGIGIEYGTFQCVFLGTIQFSGNFLRPIYLDFTPVTLTVEPTCKIIANDITRTQPFITVGRGGRVLLLSSPANYPDYGAASHGNANFIHLASGSRAVLPNAAARTAWYNGWGAIIDGSSSVELMA